MKIHPKIFFLTTFLFLSFILLSISSYNRDMAPLIREKGYTIIGSLQTTSFDLKMRLTEFLEDIHTSEKLRKENEALKAEIAKLLFKEKSYYEEIISSNQRLQEMLGFKKEQPYGLLPAEVIAYTPHNYFKVVTIGEGEKEGVEKEMAVVNAQGLVGKVIEVYPHQAKVLLIPDETSKVGVRVQRTRDEAILQGKGERGICGLKYLLCEASVEVGDRVVTSGLGGLFPEG
ncbi:rod shape-determining protein MreC, partial [Candidatus Aerophobetes bacterium]